MNQLEIAQNKIWTPRKFPAIWQFLPFSHHKARVKLPRDPCSIVSFTVQHWQTVPDRGRQHSRPATCFRGICLPSSHHYSMNLASSMIKNIAHFLVHRTSDSGPWKALRDCRLSSYFIHTETLRGAWITTKPRQRLMVPPILLLPLVKCGLRYLVLACLPPQTCYFTPTQLCVRPLCPLSSKCNLTLYTCK